MTSTPAGPPAPEISVEQLRARIIDRLNTVSLAAHEAHLSAPGGIMSAIMLTRLYAEALDDIAGIVGKSKESD